MNESTDPRAEPIPAADEPRAEPEPIGAGEPSGTPRAPTEADRYADAPESPPAASATPTADVSSPAGRPRAEAVPEPDRELVDKLRSYHFTLRLTPPQLKIVHTALQAMRDGFGHDEADVAHVVEEVLAKLPDEHSIRAIRLDDAARD